MPPDDPIKQVPYDWNMTLAIIAAAVVVIIWAYISYIRERRMADRIDALEDFIKDELMHLVSQCNQSFAGLCKLLGVRPCLNDDRDTLDELAGNIIPDVEMPVVKKRR